MNRKPGQVPVEIAARDESRLARSPAAAGVPTGFSLVEFIGVLAILAVLALVLVEVFIKHVDITAVNTETATLNSISNAIVAQVLRSDQIPDAGTWATAASKILSLPVASITNNNRNLSRVFLIDPAGWYGTNTLPYSQTTSGTWIINSARILIVSSLSANPPVTNGVMASASSFADIWNTPQGNIPGTWTGWSGRGDDLLIERLNLAPLFCQLVLVNRDNNNSAAFSVNQSFTNSLAAKSITTAYYLAGSVINLIDVTTLQTSQVLSRSLSFVYENGTWCGQIGVGTPTVPAGVGMATNYAAAVLPFLTAADSKANSGASGFAGDQEQVLAAMNDFMSAYALWYGEAYGFHGMSGGQGGPADHLSLYIYLQGSQTWLGNVAGTSANVPPGGSSPYYSGLLR